MYFKDPTNYTYLFGGIIAFVVSLLILKKDTKQLLNILFSSSLFFWSISLFCNAFTFLFINPNELSVQIIRDFATSTGVISAYLIFIVALAIYKGIYFIKKRQFVLPISIIMLINIIIVIIFDHVVWDNETGVGVKTTQESWVLIFLYVIPGILIILAEFYFIKTRNEVTDILVKRRILYFIFGFAFIFCGVLCYAIFSFIDQFIGFTYLVVEYISWIIATVLWALGPILMLVGSYLAKINKKQNNEYNENLLQ